MGNKQAVSISVLIIIVIPSAVLSREEFGFPGQHYETVRKQIPPRHFVPCRNDKEL